MQRHKAMIIIASLLVVCFFLYVFSSNSNHSREGSIKTQASIMSEPFYEDISNDVPTKDESLQEETTMETAAIAEEEDSPETLDVAGENQVTMADDHEKRTLTDEIKKKVREVVEGTINLFKKDLQVVAIGDSLTQGVGDETESGGYVGILNHTFEDNHVNIKIENYGKRGNRSDQLLKRLNQEDIADSIKNADTILITIGANDIMKVVKTNITNLQLEPFEEERLRYIERLTTIFQKINELNPNSQIYLIGFYNPFEQHFAEIEELGIIMNTWNDAGKSVTEEFDNVHYIPIADLFSNSDIMLFAEDHFHPNTIGYKKMARRILENLNEMSVETELTTDDIQ